MSKLSKNEQKMLWRILIAAALLIAVRLAVAFWVPDSATSLVVTLAYLVPYAVIGWDVMWRAIRNIAHGQVFDENFLMALATVGAFATGEYAEAVFVMLFYQVGELFQDYAVGKSRASISALMDIRPDYANVEKDGVLTETDPEEVTVGDIIVVKPGERIPLDGVIVEGASALDTAALTGESAPRDVKAGDDILSGCVNQTGLLRIRVAKPYGESTVARILDLVENASEKKAASENFITKFARYYTPCVVLAAVALAFIPPIFVGDFTDWFHRALIFLVISCPCALVISVPLSFFGGIGGASKCGILVKGSSYLEQLAKTSTVVFDKTGTLTKGTFSVTAVHPEEGYTATQLLTSAALAESYSDHPISLSLKGACKEPLDPSRVTDVEEIAGHGVRAKIDGREVCVGNSRLMERESVKWLPCEKPGTIVHVTIGGFYAGHIVISDEVKPDAAAAIADLKANGVKKVVMLTGDTKEVAASVAQTLGVDEFHAELLPADKVDLAEKLLAGKPDGTNLAFVGDGINDAPVLTRADIGIAMGAMGADAAIEAADIVLMDDQPSKIATAMRISRKTLRIVYQNIVFALGVKAVVLVLGALGMANMWLAVFADVGVAFIAILNATRALRVKEFR
ncbi:MAG: cadmium-translocating P-type ATPase [Oscillibacter sp.]|jgi:Cd2+/Zn2+-exporting ATPase|nr:cadmium-translocating P-type ATPase [Oscillibacter sp.]